MGSISYEDQTGYYRKIGSLVEFTFFIRVASGSNDSNGNHIKISLPFSQDAGSGGLHRGFGLPTYNTLASLNSGSAAGMAFYINGGYAELYHGSTGVSGSNGANQGGRYIIGGGNFHAP